MLRHIRYRPRRGYFFGYVTGDGGDEMLRAVTGETPTVIGPAILRGYELRVQHLPEITMAGENPQQILRNAWGPNFKSYVLVEKPGSQVAGTLLRLSLKARHKLDSWEMIELGWVKKKFVQVELVDSGVLVICRDTSVGRWPAGSRSASVGASILADAKAEVFKPGAKNACSPTLTLQRHMASCK